MKEEFFGVSRKDKNIENFADVKTQKFQKTGNIMELHLGDDSIIPDPDNNTIISVINNLTSDVNSFAILIDVSDETGMTYIQTALVSEEKWFVIEYHEGSTDKHFRALKEKISLEEVVEIFLSYAKRDNCWKNRFDWKEVGLDAEGFPAKEDIKEQILNEDGTATVILTSEGEKKLLKIKYGDLKVEEIALSNEIDKHTKLKLLVVLHGYLQEEAQEILDVTREETKRAKLRDVKRRIAQRVQELYKKVSVDDTRQPIPDQVKIFVWQRDEGKCVKCGSKENLEFDHIIPVSKGGSNTERNIQLLCEKCNRSKRDGVC